MIVQKVSLDFDRHSYIVLDNDYSPIKPILKFIRHLDNTGKSIHTVRSYAHHLKLYWDYLNENDLAWATITLEHLSEFVGWLRTNKSFASDNVIDLEQRVQRQASSINSLLGCLASFYAFHNHLGNTNVSLKETVSLPGSRYKSLLHHVYRNKPAQRRIISLRQNKMLPKTISKEQFNEILNVCNNARDQFLISLLYETGMRIGEALNLKHADIITWDNQIHVTPRLDLDRETKSKSQTPNVLQVTQELIRKYLNYTALLSHQNDSDYVFIRLHDQVPMRYSSVRKLFINVSKRIGYKVTAHMFRHSHATELIKTGVDSSLVQKRLGHASVQTTINTYSHIDDDTMKKALQSYWKKSEDK